MSILHALEPSSSIPFLPHLQGSVLTRRTVCCVHTTAKILYRRLMLTPESAGPPKGAGVIEKAKFLIEDEKKRLAEKGIVGTLGEGRPRRKRKSIQATKLCKCQYLMQRERGIKRGRNHNLSD